MTDTKPLYGAPQKHRRACFNCEGWMYPGRWGWYCFDCVTYQPTGFADELATMYFAAKKTDEIRAEDIKELLEYCERETIRTAEPPKGINKND